MLRARYPPAASDGGPGEGAMDGDDKDELEDFRDQVRGRLRAALLLVARCPLLELAFSSWLESSQPQWS